MGLHNYILNEAGEPVIEYDLLKWARAFEKMDRIVARDEIGDIRVSTVFLGIDHSFDFTSTAKPVLWETMIFGSKVDRSDGYQERYNTRLDAEEGHIRALKVVLKSSHWYWRLWWSIGAIIDEKTWR